MKRIYLIILLKFLPLVSPAQSVDFGDIDWAVKARLEEIYKQDGIKIDPFKIKFQAWTADKLLCEGNRYDAKVPYSNNGVDTTDDCWVCVSIKTGTYSIGRSGCKKEKTETLIE